MFLGQSSVAGQRVLRVRNWERLVSKGRGGSRANGRMSAALLGSVCGLRTLVRRRLLNLPGGTAAYGVWILLWTLAAESCVPGVFLDDEHTPLTVEDLALLTDVRLDELQSALDILSGPEVRLIETVSLEDVLPARVPALDGSPDVSQVERGTSGLIETDPVANGSLMATDSLVGAVPDSTVDDAEGRVDAGADELSDSRRLKVTATDAQPVSPFAGLSELPEQDLLAETPEIRTCRLESDVVAEADDASDSRRLKVAATDAKREDGGLDKIEQQMSQLAGICDQVDKLKRHVAAMTTGTPILTASRKGQPNGWKVNATLNPGKK